VGRAPEIWRLRRDGHDHELEIVDAGLSRRLTWRVDGEEVASRKTSDERVVLTSRNGSDAAAAVRAPGALGVRLPPLVGPARRVTLYDDEVGARTGMGGVDLDPKPGSKAAAREEWIRAHPNLHTARRTATAAAGVVVPLVLLWLLAKVALPAIPWPDLDLPTIPLPDLPSIPWPDLDLPAIPWPDLPELPQWVKDAAKLVGPVLIAFALARAEVRRRRTQDRHKAEERKRTGG